jgi:hypothetical protein
MNARSASEITRLPLAPANARPKKCQSPMFGLPAPLGPDGGVHATPSVKLARKAVR